MTTCLGKSCSFGLQRVPFVNCCQFMYWVISLLVLRAGCGIWLYRFLIIAYLFTLDPAQLLCTDILTPKIWIMPTVVLLGMLWLKLYNCTSQGCYYKTFVKIDINLRQISMFITQSTASLRWQVSSFQMIIQGLPINKLSITTINFLNIRTPKQFVVITLKFELCGSTIE